MSSLNLMELPHEPFERRKALLLHGIDERVDLAIVRFQKQHGKGSFYEACHTFVFHDLYDAPRSDFNSLRRVGFFPWLEIQRELSEAINHALLASLVQSGRLHKLVLPEVAPSLCRLQQEDDEIISVTAWFDSLPDISDEEIDRQVKEQEEWTKSMQGTEQREQ